MSRRPTRAARFACLPLAALVALAGCLPPRRPPVLTELVQREARTPVVLVPGITGTRLRNQSTGRLVWGNGRSVFLPRDGGRTLAVPLTDEATPGNGLRPDGPVARVNVFGLLRFEVYSALIRLMEANGYRYGTLADPKPGDGFFIFAYDWRFGNVRSAIELAEALERLRVARGEDVLRVTLICQSNAARIGRFYLKYGGASLEEAESGHARPPRTVSIDKMILLGTDHAGGIRAMIDLNRGRRYVPVLGRRFRPEMVFTFESIYEGLPLLRRDLFFDSDGNVLDLDLLDVGNWKRYGWSVYGRKTAKRLQKDGAELVYGDESGREAFLRTSLDRAKRLHRVLLRDVEDFGGTRYYAIQSGQRPTPSRALLVETRRGWRTFFTHDRAVKDDPWFRSLATEPGDGHATLTSQRALSPQESAALAESRTVWVEEAHRLIILDRAAHRAILEFLAER